MASAARHFCFSYLIEIFARYLEVNGNKSACLENLTIFISWAALWVFAKADTRSEGLLVVMTCLISTTNSNRSACPHTNFLFRQLLMTDRIQVSVRRSQLALWDSLREHPLRAFHCFFIEHDQSDFDNSGPCGDKIAHANPVLSKLYELHPPIRTTMNHVDLRGKVPSVRLASTQSYTCGWIPDAIV